MDLSRNCQAAGWPSAAIARLGASRPPHYWTCKRSWCTTRVLGACAQWHFITKKNGSMDLALKGRDYSERDPLCVRTWYCDSTQSWPTRRPCQKLTFLRITDLITFVSSLQHQVHGFLWMKMSVFMGKKLEIPKTCFDMDIDRKSLRSVWLFFFFVTLAHS